MGAKQPQGMRLLARHRLIRHAVKTVPNVREMDFDIGGALGEFVYVSQLTSTIKPSGPLRADSGTC